jgi:hypothetical protein
MDTDDLSIEAYKGILSEAEKLTHDLTLHYGLLSYDCNNETEYLNKAAILTKKILVAKGYELDDLFWGNPPNKKKLEITLKKILSNIEEINKIPIEKRHYD